MDKRKKIRFCSCILVVLFIIVFMSISYARKRKEYESSLKQGEQTVEDTNSDNNLNSQDVLDLPKANTSEGDNSREEEVLEKKQAENTDKAVESEESSSDEVNENESNNSQDFTLPKEEQEDGFSPEIL